jgi:hypothetical protein
LRKPTGRRLHNLESKWDLRAHPHDFEDNRKECGSGLQRKYPALSLAARSPRAKHRTRGSKNPTPRLSAWELHATDDPPEPAAPTKHN